MLKPFGVLEASNVVVLGRRLFTTLYSVIDVGPTFINFGLNITKSFFLLKIEYFGTPILKTHIFPSFWVKLSITF